MDGDWSRGREGHGARATGTLKTILTVETSWKAPAVKLWLSKCLEILFCLQKSPGGSLTPTPYALGLQAFQVCSPSPSLLGPESTVLWRLLVSPGWAAHLISVSLSTCSVASESPKWLLPQGTLAPALASI